MSHYANNDLMVMLSQFERAGVPKEARDKFAKLGRFCTWKQSCKRYIHNGNGLYQMYNTLYPEDKRVGKHGAH